MLPVNERIGRPVLLTLLCALALGGCRMDETSYETCSVCQSSRQLSQGNETILFRSPQFEHGAHAWERGLKLAEPSPLGLGSVLLLKRVPPGGTTPVYAAVIITEQQASPERMSYRWYLRPDGGGELDPSAAVVQHGEERGQSRLKFGPFDLHWSGSGDRGAGFVYYERFTHMPVDSHITFLSRTDLTSVVGLNAADPRWQYKSSVVD
jgi:hypothetical protein